ncbi:hypothetical protein RM553_09520 [Zunongwangia sp. F363]|uniref:Uncharacterized protein n=1 Tax=Autumnicola tepida TaxID=3075595 RepID=A0ABU3C9Q2_9FLAO|nr:hypothetical protein [Zunongwangia sp. F363]MDT0643065.1 hypothetical protein [Zunongwangia sp. F363]
MEDAFQNPELIENCTGNFIFRKKDGFKIDPNGILIPARNLNFYKLGGKFISINMEKSRRSKKEKIFRCAYKMMKAFNRSLN